LNGIKGRAAKAYFLADPSRKPLSFKQEGDKVSVALPPDAPDKMDTVVVFELASN
jgi:hypothetical protein